MRPTVLLAAGEFFCYPMVLLYIEVRELTIPTRGAGE